MNAIEIKHLYKTFESDGGNVEALKDINLEIKKGSIYGIIGMSGAGKSTLVRCMNYLEKPTEGEVIIGSTRLQDLSDKSLRAERQKISMIFQHFNLLMQKNVIENVSFPLRLSGVSKRESAGKAYELLKTVGLEEKANAYPSQLSGGQQQRVAIARALASDPEILLCDEATSALDPQTTATILSLLKEINKKLNITIVIITHQMSVVREVCSDVAIVEAGSIVESGRVEDIFAHPKSRAAKELIFRDLPEQGSAPVETYVSTLESQRNIRVIYSENSSYEPIIANMILNFGAAVNILRANTKNVGGVAKGEMILGLPDNGESQDKMIKYLQDKGLEVEEVRSDEY